MHLCCRARLPRRALFGLALASLMAASGFVQAQDYPNRPIKLVIPFPAGGSSDGIGRQIADKLGPLLKPPSSACRAWTTSSGSA